MLGSWQRPSQRSVWQKRLVSRSRTQTAPVGGDRDSMSVHRTITGTPWHVSVSTSPITWPSTSWFLTIYSSLISTKSYDFTLIENSLEEETKMPKLLLERGLTTSALVEWKLEGREGKSTDLKWSFSAFFLMTLSWWPWGGGLHLPALWAEQRRLKLKGGFKLQLKLLTEMSPKCIMMLPQQRVNKSSINVNSLLRLNIDPHKAEGWNASSTASTLLPLIQHIGASQRARRLSTSV